MEFSGSNGVGFLRKLQEQFEVIEVSEHPAIRIKDFVSLEKQRNLQK